MFLFASSHRLATIVLKLLATLCLIAAIAVPVAIAQTPVRPASTGRKPIEGCQVIARINNDVILASDILWEVNLILEDNKHLIPPEQLDEARESIVRSRLRGYIEMRLIFADFMSENGRKVDMQAIYQQLDEPFYSGGKSGDMRGTAPSLMQSLNAGTLQELEQKLLSIGTSLEERRKAFAEQQIAMQWIQGKIKVTAPDYADMIEYYQSHIADYSYPRQARWEELAVRFSNHPNEDSARKKLVAMGNQAWARQMATPETNQPLLGDIARKESEGFNQDSGGLYDWTTDGTLLDADLNRAVFGLPVGKLSPIVKSSIGYHIVRVIERREAGVKPFLEVQDEIRDQITRERNSEEMKRVIGELQKSSRIWTIFTGQTTAEAYLRPANGPVTK